MMLGGAGVTLLGFIAIAVIGNLFSPESFAIYRLVITYGAIISLFLTLRIELSIVVSDSLNEAINKTEQILIQVFFIAFLFFIIFNFFNIGNFLSNFGLTKNILNIFLILGIFISFTEVFIQFLIYENKFKSVSLIQIIYGFFFILCLIFFYVIDFGPLSPSIARILCFILGTLIFLYLTIKKISFKNFGNPFNFIKNNKDYVFKNLPYSVLTQFTQSIPILILLYLGSDDLAGQFAFLLSLAMFPGMFLNGSIGKVFFKKIASIRTNKQKVFSLIDSIMQLILIITIPLAGLFFVYYYEIISFIFGVKWLDVNFDVRLIFICGFLYLFSSWPERIFVVFKRQGLILQNQIIFDSIMFVTLIIVFYTTNSAVQVVLAYVTVNILYHLTYISLAYYLVTQNFFKYIAFGIFFAGALFLLKYTLDYIGNEIGKFYFILLFTMALFLYLVIFHKKIKILIKNIGKV